jgi:hypothetical protein
MHRHGAIVERKRERSGVGKKVVRQEQIIGGLQEHRHGLTLPFVDAMVGLRVFERSNHEKENLIVEQLNNFELQRGRSDGQRQV